MTVVSRIMVTKNKPGTGLDNCCELTWTHDVNLKRRI